MCTLIDAYIASNKGKELNRKNMLDLKTTLGTCQIINSFSLNAEEVLMSDKVFQASEIRKIHTNSK